MIIGFSGFFVPCFRMQAPRRSERVVGFDCTFVTSPPEGVLAECPICLLVIREPHQVTCCGKRFCQTCIESIKSANKACPTCNTRAFRDFPDKANKLSLYSLKVYCSHKKDGCQWIGELRELEAHLNEDPQPENKLKGCMYTTISCDFFYIGCETRVYRKDISEHLREALHTHTALMVSEHQKVASSNAKLIEDHQRLERNYAQLAVNHTSLADEHKRTYYRLAAEQAAQARAAEELGHKYERLNRNFAELKSENGQLKSRITVLEIAQAQKPAPPAPVPPGPTSKLRLPQTKLPRMETIKINSSNILTMRNVEQYRRDKNWWYSHPVYTHHQGYKICLGVYPNGFEQDTHVSVYIYFVKGEFDDYLTWPFLGVIYIKLIDQKEGNNDKSFTVVYDETVNPEFRQRVRSEERSKRGWGTPTFIPYSQLKPRYLLENTLLFKITGGEAQVVTML